MKKLIRISASDYTPHLIKVSPTDKKYILDKLNKSHKTLGDLGSARDPGYYISEFEPAYGLYLWASDTGLRILDDNGIEYTEVKKAIGASTKVTAATNYDTKLIAKWLKAKFDDEAFGTAYTMHRISDADAYMSRNGLTYNRRNNTIDLWKSGGDEDIPVYKVIPQYSSTKRQGTYAPKMPKLVPIDEWNATHGVTASTRVTATEDNVTTIYGDYDTTLTIDMWYGDKFVPRKYGADASIYGNGEYRGNIYNESGKIIGDYTSDNSVLIEENFLIDFGE